ncbi:MAG: hypothetical protein Q9163_004905 [Psora crenata]
MGQKDDLLSNKVRENQVVAIKAPKCPPPEGPEGPRLRGLVILSFWAVVIFLGVPVWLWTTSIYRARLPLGEMLGWADGKACKPSFPLQIAIEAPDLQEAEATHLMSLTQHALDDRNEFSAHHLRLQLAKSIRPLDRVNAFMPIIEGDHSSQSIRKGADGDKVGECALTVSLQLDDNIAVPQSELRKQSTTLDVRYPASQVPLITSSSSTLSSYIAAQLQGLFAEEQAIIEYILTTSQSSASPSAQASPSTNRELRSRRTRSLHPDLAAKLASRMIRSLKYAATYHVTISLFTPTSVPSSWDIETAIGEYFIPLLKSLSAISNFTVDTQVQLHANLSPSVHLPEHDREANVWTLRDEDLSGFINAAEWPLSPSIGAGPTLNFILYVPDQSTSPLVVKGSRASSWLVPQWGGVTILNPSWTANGTANGTAPTECLSKDLLKPALLTFSHQLLSLLGAPDTPPLLALQLQTLTRIRAASLLLSASSTMGSLARLTVALPSIAIPETVSAAVDTTLAHLQSTCNALKEGRFREALDHARVAEAQAEKGFFEKSMVGQVYFPDEHKVAVYLPLLGPIGVPLIMSALKEAKRRFAARRAKLSTTRIE